uniref:Trichohyalin-plectin-homology domain-containing protein n=1 Tax=Timema bartmani TaxID=61472 RepID=A0A7R9EQ00_9NEOP|nr:unnamed protein product [Timema bartmani]
MYSGIFPYGLTLFFQANQIQENLAARAQKMGEVVGAIKDTRDAEEDEAIRKAIAERELKESERLTREAEYRRSLVEEKKQVQREYVASETLRKAQERHLLKWDMMQRFKQEEMDREFEFIKSTERRGVLLDNRNTYKKQMVEVLEMKKQEREMDKLAVQRAAEAWSADDKAFLQYADEVIQDSRRMGRPIEPLLRIVKEYKKKNNLEPKVKLPPLLRSRVPIVQACHPKCAGRCSETN